jgi:hypothetical protein
VGYELAAVLAKREVFDAIGLPDSIPVAPLGHGFALVPLTRAVRAGIERDRPLRDVLRAWSAHGPVIYATSRLHAGVGPQDAEVWFGGVSQFAQSGQPCSGPISMALQRLGVPGGRFGWDEFDIVGLGRHRRTEGWLADCQSDA